MREMRASFRRSGLIAIGLVFWIGLGWWSIRPALLSNDFPVIIYVVDTLRADRLSLYGYTEPTSPRLDELVADSVIFEQAYAPAPWTPPSVASLITSTYACEHGVNGWTKLSSAYPTLAERLRGAGFMTASYHSNLYAGSMMNIDRGHEISEMRRPEDNVRAQDVVDFLHEFGEEPYFLYLHTMEPHASPNTPNRFINKLVGFLSLDDRNSLIQAKTRYAEFNNADANARQRLGTTDNTILQNEMLDYFRNLSFISPLYDASVAWADRNVGDVIDVLKETGAWDSAIFIFVADHGEEMGEHGGWLHGQSVYDELMRVPLIVHFPNGEFGGQRIREAVSLVDLMPTIFDYQGRPNLCNGCRGTSLLPLLRGQAQAGATRSPTIVGLRHNQFQYYRPWKESRGDLNVVLRQGDWKGIWNNELGTLELYDLKLDPGEHNDVSVDNPELSRQLANYGVAWIESCSANATVPEIITEWDAETKEKLRALGYFH